MLLQNSKYIGSNSKCDSSFVGLPPKPSRVGLPFGSIFFISMLASIVTSSSLFVTPTQPNGFRRFTITSSNFDKIIQNPSRKSNSLVTCAIHCAKDEKCAVFGFFEGIRGVDVSKTACTLGQGPVNSVLPGSVDTTPWENSVVYKKDSYKKLEVIACSSQDYKRQICQASGPVVDYSLVTQHSQTPCTTPVAAGITQDGHFFVDNGCRGDFQLTIDW